MTLWLRLGRLFGRRAPHPPGPEILATLPAEEAAAEPAPTTPPAFFLTGHIATIGDRQPNANGWVGSASGLGCIEGFLLSSDRPGWRDDVTAHAVLQGGDLGPAVPGGSYCGTRGKDLPLQGYLVGVAEGTADLAGLTCEGVFQDGFRSGRLPAGTACVSPTQAALVAMRIALGPVPDTGPEGTLPSGLHWCPPALMAEPPAPPPGRVAFLAAEESLVPGTEPFGTTLVGHIANVGDTAADAQGWVGATEKFGRIEGFTFASARPEWHRDVCYQALPQTGDPGPLVPGGAYCGTRGEALPIYGFVVHVRQGAKELGGLAYEGIFEGGFRSGTKHPGELCVAPDRAPLTALRIAVAPQTERRQDAAEPVRAVIWDLDETFWAGTLTESGISWREENAEIVRTLARRGIVSSICSKNDFADTVAVLEEHGMRDYFVFPSISWDSKGPRLKTLVETLQLRAPTLMFIDDNPMNRAEAENFVPGLQVQDETIVPKLLDHPLLRGKPDPQMTRLAQYRLLERRHADQAQSGGDTADFLRASGITVTIEHDLAPHLDRAVELINRTNQLNFTKRRLGENSADPEMARRELRALLADHEVQAGILHVRDRYGDYGFCGIYVRHRPAGAPELLHFAFSCRILGMGIETWLYRRLQRPRLNVVGPVLADVFDEAREIDWIGAELPGIASVPAAPRHELSYVLARGACDMRALSHYFGMIAGRVIEEFDTLRFGQQPLVNHSLIAAQAIKGIDPLAIEDFAPLGFLPEDFNTVLAGDAPAGPALWLLGFTVEQPGAVYRHKATGALLPATVMGLRSNAAAMMRGGPSDGADPRVIAHLREKFEFFGQRPDPRLDRLLQESLRLIFSRAGQDVRVFVFLANAYRLNGEGKLAIAEGLRHHNGVIAEVAREFRNVELVSPESFMTLDELRALADLQHFDRITYFRIFQHIAGTINKGGEELKFR